MSMFKKSMNKFTSVILIIVIASSSFFVSSAKAQDSFDLDNYLKYFYNRYAKHLNKWGLVYKAPVYGVSNFQKAKTAREILSLAIYFKYRAAQGESRARRIIRAAILNAEHELNSRSADKHSFSDAWAQLAIISLIKQLPDILTPDEQQNIYQQISARACDGILAPDSSNRAALSAVYWQYIINQLFDNSLISSEQKAYYDQLIYKKIISIIGKDVSLDGWYREGSPMKFNPHYHLVTAFAFMAYAEMTGNIQTYILAKKMTGHLRQISFPNGMLEARIGNRPVGLGAQFYLGMGLLNYKFGFKDYSVYFNYALGDRFFSDTKYPNRLEYHSTVYNSRPDYHDDISFSNLAELALVTPKLAWLVIDLNQKRLNGTQPTIYFKDLEIKQLNSDYSSIQRRAVNQQMSLKVRPAITNIAATYGCNRLTADKENKKAQELFSKLGAYELSPQSKNILAAAYIYGGYQLEEIIDTITNGPRAVHPKIPATIWRDTPNYQKYLKSLGE